MSAPLSLRTIARALGGEIAAGQVVAPGPGHSRHDRSMTVRLSQRAPDGFVVFSHAGDDFAACKDYVRDRLGLDRDGWKHDRDPVTAPEPIRQIADDADAKRNLRFAAEIAAGMVPIKGTPGEAYLRVVRKIDTDAIADVLGRVDALGWNPSVKFNERGHALCGRSLGCIVGVMTGFSSAAATGAISRTYLAPEGGKLDKAKSLGAPAGIVRISADDEVTHGLFLCEGLETALTAAALGLRPIWSTGSTAIMASFPPLAGIEALTIIADHDAGGAGLKAATVCASTWRAAGREVRILMRDRPGDLNDAVRGIA